MKILFFCEGLDEASARAQPWRHVIEISERMRKLGNDVQILSDFGKKTAKCEQIQGLPVRRIKRKGFFLDMDDLLENIRKDDFDIINWHGSDTWSSFYLSRLGKHKSGSLVWTLHSGPISMSDLRNLTLQEMSQLYRYWNNILNAVFPSPMIRKWTRSARIKRVIALSHRLSKHLKMIGMRVNSLSVIPSGVDTKRFNPSCQENARENLGLPTGDPIILYYGPLSSFRGVDTLVSAVPLIRKKISSTRILFIGRGSERSANLSKKLNQADVLVKSDVLPEELIIRYLDAADIVVLPFKFWPQVECPLTLLESMAMEKAVVTTSSGAISEIVHCGENGVLVPPGNPFKLAEEVTRLLQDQELRRHIGRSAREYVKNRFDWEIIVDQTLKAFEEVPRND